MKKLVIITILLSAFIACENDKTKNEQAERIQELEEKIDELYESKADELKQDEKLEDETKIRQIEDLKAKYKHLRAKFVDTGEGDLFYYFFIDEKGNQISFTHIEDKSYELLIDDESTNFGVSINPEYKNKDFDIFYKVEKHDLLGWGEIEDVKVVKKMLIVE
jgi:hypothetical protein